MNYKFIIIFCILIRSCTSLKDPNADLTSLQDPNADTSVHNIEKRNAVAKINEGLGVVQQFMDVLANALDKGDESSIYRRFSCRCRVDLRVVYMLPYASFG